MFNIGHIPGSISYIEKPLEFGGTLKCVPDKPVNVNPCHYAGFIISFYTEQEGKFVEKVEFRINESNEIIHFVLT